MACDWVHGMVTRDAIPNLYLDVLVAMAEVICSCHASCEDKLRIVKKFWILVQIQQDGNLLARNAKILESVVSKNQILLLAKAL